jgi:hypothetical protein
VVLRLQEDNRKLHSNVLVLLLASIAATDGELVAHGGGSMRWSSSSKKTTGSFTVTCPSGGELVALGGG